MLNLLVSVVLVFPLFITIHVWEGYDRDPDSPTYREKRTMTRTVVTDRRAQRRAIENMENLAWDDPTSETLIGRLNDRGLLAPYRVDDPSDEELADRLRKDGVIK